MNFFYSWKGLAVMTVAHILLYVGVLVLLFWFTGFVVDAFREQMRTTCYAQAEILEVEAKFVPKITASGCFVRDPTSQKFVPLSTYKDILEYDIRQ